MLSKVRNTALTLAALVAVAFGAAAIAGAADSGTSKKATPKAGSTATPRQAPDPSRAQHPGETLLTGDAAEKVKAAALAKVPGATILRVETDAEGSPYEAHVRKSDGSEVTVKVDKDFSATSVEDFGHGGRGGPGGPPPASTGSGTSSGAAYQGTLQ